MRIDTILTFVGSLIIQSSLILLGVLASAPDNFVIHVHCSVSCCTFKGDPLLISGVPFSFYYSTLQTLAAFVSLDSPLYLLSLGSLPGPARVPLPCALSWKLKTIMGGKPRNHFVSHLSGIAVLCCLISSVLKSLFHVFV